jgi:hypothetical protein
VSENSNDRQAIAVSRVACRPVRSFWEENIALAHCSTDDLTMNPLSLVVTCVAGRMSQQQVLIEYLHEEVRVLRCESSADAS